MFTNTHIELDKHIVEDNITNLFDDDVEFINKDSAKEKCITLLDDLIKDYPKYSQYWDICKENELFFKEVRIKVSFPLKRVSNFIVMKQIVLTFKLGENKYSGYKLYLQTLLRINTSTVDKLDIKNRIIWAKEGRFITDTDVQIDPEVLSILTKIGDIFWFNSKSMVDILFPFLS